MHFENMVDCDYPQVERVLRKIHSRILEYFSNIQVLPVENLVLSKNFRFKYEWYTKSKIGFPTNLKL